MPNNKVSPVGMELQSRQKNTGQQRTGTSSANSTSNNEESGEFYLKVLYVLNILFFILLLISIAAVVLAVQKSKERHEMAMKNAIEYEKSCIAEEIKPEQKLKPVTMSDSRENASYARLAQISSDLDELRVVRLVGNSSNEFEGRVEVFHQGEWGQICGHGWLLTDANVVCHMLGYVNASLQTTDCTFGCGTGRFWLDYVRCAGFEWDIRSCIHEGWGVIDPLQCPDTGTITAGVICTV